jgi:hypothetical protein
MRAVYTESCMIVDGGTAQKVTAMRMPKVTFPVVSILVYYFGSTSGCRWTKYEESRLSIQEHESPVSDPKHSPL